MAKRKKRGGGRVRMILMIVLAVVFIASAAGFIVTRLQAEQQKQFYVDMAQQYTETAAPEQQMDDAPPIVVDFAALRAANSDIAGWIYCEGTEINYPVMHGRSNDDYLRRDFERKSSTAGSIFMEVLNQPDFSDANTILYGHHMADGSMFAALQSWQDQAFFDAHPVIWLLTPEQNYKILLFSAYPTTGDSGTYSIYTGPCEPLDAYLDAAAEHSLVHSDVTRDSTARYVVLSTCASAYGSGLERHVLHGMLQPVE